MIAAAFLFTTLLGLQIIGSYRLEQEMAQINTARIHTETGKSDLLISKSIINNIVASLCTRCINLQLHKNK